MRRRLLGRISTIIGWALGLTACGDSFLSPDYGIPEYGMPHADFDLDGKVVRVGTTNDIPGIEIEFAGAKTVADENGEWTISLENVLSCRSQCNLVARDIDGDANGSYEEKTVEFSTNQVSGGSGGWDEGEWVAHDINVEMDPTEGSAKK